MTTAQPFHPAGPLPADGITVIEASAGTGKTYTLTSLVLRFVADGVPLSALLAVTFTRMATGELRDRIRTRLVDAHRRLGDLLAEGPGPPGDPFGGDAVLAVLGSGGVERVSARCTRLADALADFDSATIATTHGFCQLVLHGLGTAGDALPGTTLLEDPADLIEEVIDDLYLRRSLLHPAEDPPFSLAQARRAALEATRSPDTHLVPAPGEDPCGLLRRLAEAARAEIGRRLLEDRCLTYDHLLFRLARTLEDPDRGPEACRRLGERYRVVLVDEFQDTDPVQWTVLRRAFTGGATKLVLIGDPKQAVYGFRGADVHAYLDAAEAAGSVHTLDTNWRADQALLDATAALFDPLQFGHRDITFRTVRAPSGRQEAGIRGGLSSAPMRWRVVDDRQNGITLTSRGLLSKPALAEWVALDVAADVARLLDSGTELLEDGAWRRVEERDIAVLTRTNAQALAVRDAMREAGVASVVAGLDSVFRSEGAEAWLRLLEGLQEPSSRSRAAAVALGPFIGMGRVEAATAPEAVWETVHDRLHRWAAVLSGRGVAALYRAITIEEGLPGRLLASAGGERTVTDLGHVAQLLHAEASAGQLGAPSLRNWLATRIRSVAEEQAEAEDRSRRLDSDAEAVQVLTVHAAKGLEFGIVYCPFMWDPGPPERGSPPVVFHDPESGDRRTLDVGCPVSSGPLKASYSRNATLARAERRAEDLRLLYVALTRGRHRLVIWWGRTQECRHSPLGRLLISRDGLTGEVRDARGGEPTGRQVRTALEAVAARAPGLVEIETAERQPRGAGRRDRSRPPALPVALSSAAFTRSLDLHWRRSSYSSITAAAHERPSAGRGGVGSEPESPGLDDEPDGLDGLDGVGLPDAPAGTGPAGAQRIGQAGTGEAGPVPTGGEDRVSPLSVLPGGPETGTFVHRVLEATDFAAADLPGELAAAVALTARRDGVPTDPAPLVPGLHAALTTPLGPLLDGTVLADVTRADRLDELGFELPVAGGEDPTGAVGTGDIARLLAAHLPPGDRLAPYPARLLDPLLDTRLRGYLTGSLDLVFRRTLDDGKTRWFVADYKTNRLGGRSGPLMVSSYRAPHLDAEMQRRHYPLQALIYMVALHRYLRWRVAGYRPETHLGGVLYLFVRGMAGPATPVADGSVGGVWSWSVPAGLVTGLSDLFEAGRPDVGRRPS